MPAQFAFNSIFVLPALSSWTDCSCFASYIFAEASHRRLNSWKARRRAVLCDVPPPSPSQPAGGDSARPCHPAPHPHHHHHADTALHHAHAILHHAHTTITLPLTSQENLYRPIRRQVLDLVRPGCHDRRLRLRC